VVAFLSIVLQAAKVLFYDITKQRSNGKAGMKATSVGGRRRILKICITYFILISSLVIALGKHSLLCHACSLLIRPSCKMERNCCCLKTFRSLFTLICHHHHIDIDVIPGEEGGAPRRQLNSYLMCFMYAKVLRCQFNKCQQSFSRASEKIVTNA
jgi:hypothetical protein